MYPARNDHPGSFSVRMPPPFDSFYVVCLREQICPGTKWNLAEGRLNLTQAAVSISTEAAAASLTPLWSNVYQGDSGGSYSRVHQRSGTGTGCFRLWS